MGCGFTARMHARHAEANGRAVVVGVVGREEAAAERMIGECGLKQARAFADFGTMLGEARPEAVVLAVPPAAHAGEAEAAAARGVHVFMEKPIARTLERAESQVAALEKAGVVTQVDYHFRFKEAVRRFDGVEAGSPTLFQGRFWCRFPGAAWWRDRAQSGGQMFEQAIHLLDLACYYLGEPVTVSAHLDNLAHRNEADYTVEDTGVALVRFACGAMATVSCSNVAVPERFMADFRLICTEALLDYQSSGDWRQADRAVLYHQSREEIWTETGNPHAAAMENFLEAVAAGRPARVPVREGLRTVRVALAAAESAARGGEPVRLA